MFEPPPLTKIPGYAPRHVINCCTLPLTLTYRFMNRISPNTEADSKSERTRWQHWLIGSTDDIHAIGVRLFADDLQQKLFNSARWQVVNWRVVLMPKPVFQLHCFDDPPNSSHNTISMTQMQTHTGHVGSHSPLCGTWWPGIAENSNRTQQTNFSHRSPSHLEQSFTTFCAHFHLQWIVSVWI